MDGPRILGCVMGRSAARPGGLLIARTWVLAISLLLALTTLGSAPTLAVERAANAPGQPGADELETVASQSLSDVPIPVELPDLATAADAVLEYAWSLPIEDWDIEILAVELDFDPMAAFRFVRDHIRYEPYAGILRGAEGTLAARAGNSLDRSLLLAALLDEMLVDSEFAIAQLDETAIAQVMEAARRGPALQLDGELPGARIDTRDIAVRARRDYALLQPALAPYVPMEGGLDEAAAEADARTHVWLRIPFGTETLDLDPTLADAEPGDTLGVPDQILQVLPDDLRHRVRLQVVLEELHDGNVSERVVLEEQFDALEGSGRELFLLFEPDLEGLAGAINAVLSGDERWSPVFLRDGERTMGDSFSAGGRGSDLLGDPTDLPEPLSLRLVAATEGPGLEPQQATHVLFDRRTDGSLPGDPLGEAPVAALVTEAGIPTALTGIASFAVSTGGQSVYDFTYRHAQVLDFIDFALLDDDTAAQYSLADRLWPLAMAGGALVQTSEQVLVPAAGGIDGHGYVARPRVYVTTIGPASDDTDAIVQITDLMLDDVRILPSTSGGPTVPGQIWYGTLQSALETESGLLAADAVAEDEPSLTGASLSMQEPLSVLMPETDQAPAGSSGALRRDLESGVLVVLPEAAGSIDAWWAVEPDSGATRAMLAPGLRGVREVLAEPRGGPEVSDEIYRKSEIGSKSKARPNRGPGGVRRALGYNPDDYKPPRKPGLPQGEKFKFPKTKRPPLRPNPAPRCSGQGEYMTVVGCVSLPTAGAFYLLGAVYAGSITGITYGLLKIWLE